MSERRLPPLPAPFRRLPERADMAEILDESGAVGDRELRRSLRAMARVNERLGGIRSLVPHLDRLARIRNLPALRVLDLGTGSGETPRALEERLRPRGVEVMWCGLDRNERVIQLTGRPGERLVVGDALSLPFSDDAFDVVTSTLFLHHFPDSVAERVLAEAARVARHAVIMSDLERHPLHYLGARCLGITVWRRDPVTRYDGPVSVLRAFTRRELRGLGDRLPFQELRIHRHLPFRVVLVGALA